MNLYGFKSGTDKFAACMQNIENSRNLAELQSELLQQAQYQAADTQRQLDNMQRQQLSIILLAHYHHRLSHK